MLPGLEQLAAQCAPQVAPVTMLAIVKVESGGNPLAINVNGGSRLLRQPKSREQAIAWSQWLIANGYSVDMGLAQVNSANLRRLRASVADMFDPCANLAAGASILAANYANAAPRHANPQDALKAALSAYNTGNHRSGLTNGYVAKVTAAAYPDRVAKEKPPLARKLRERDNPLAPRTYYVKRPGAY